MIEAVIIFALILLFFVLVLLGFAFWIMMLVDAAKRKFSKSDDRVIWILVIALAGIVGAVIYYFFVKRKG